MAHPMTIEAVAERRISDLIEQIEALLALDAKGALVPHGIGGLARELLTRSIAELSRRTPASGAGVVKALEWRQTPGGAYEAFPHYADCSDSGYIVAEQTDDIGWCASDIENETLASGVSLEEAKAAAQADYEARVLSALSSPPPDRDAAEWQRAAMDETITQIRRQPFVKGDLFDHIKGMPERMTADFSEAKIGRWLGWVQGVACANGWLTLDKVKAINKAASDAAALKTKDQP